MKQKLFTFGTGRLYTTGEFVSYRGAVCLDDDLRVFIEQNQEIK